MAEADLAGPPTSMVKQWATGGQEGEPGGDP